MTDPCLTCILPTCNERDPRCAWKKSPEYTHLREIWRTARERRKARERKAAGYLSSKGYTFQLRHQARMLWRRGMDTIQIAAEMQIKESEVYNDLLPWIVARSAVKQ